jgi:branched-chain amino acid transport system ATP-binding protein
MRVMRLSVEGLEARYGSSQVLFGVDMRVQDGETVALLGRNGAGKTTTLHCIMGVVSARSGSIAVDGRQTIGLSAHRIARLGVGLAPQGRRVFAELTVEENLRAGMRTLAVPAAAGGEGWMKAAQTRLGGRRLGGRMGSGTAVGGTTVSKTTAGGPTLGGTMVDETAFGGTTVGDAAHRWTIAELFEVFPLLERVRKSKGAWLSGGEQQVLSIARALISGPGILLLDEPTEGLAPRVVETLAEQLHRIKRAGLTIVLAEQHLGLVGELASRAYVIDRGVVRVEGEPTALLADPQIRHAYLSL